MGKKGFSLIELVVTLAIFGALFSTAFIFGLPQYNRYVFRSEKEDFKDMLLRVRTLTISTGQNFDLSVLPKEVNDKAIFYQINIDQDGFIDGI